MAAFAAFGKYTAEFGGPDILTEYHKKGSLKSFFSGKGYKRSKKADHLLAFAREVLHFQSFLESNEATETSCIIEVEVFNFETNDSCDPNLSKAIQELFKEYEQCKKKTEIAIHGETT